LIFFLAADCDLTCDQSEKLVRINSTHCECHCKLIDKYYHKNISFFVFCIVKNQCEEQPPVCDPRFPCKKLDGPDYECECTTGFQHPPLNLTHCEGKQNEYQLIPSKIFVQDIDECKDANTCGENQRCNNTDGSYHVGFQKKKVDLIIC